MRGLRIAAWAVMAASFAGGATLVRAGQQGVGQTPGGLPLSQSIRERGSSLTGAFEGWYYGKDGATYALVGYFNRNTKQEFDIPVGPNNRVEPGGPDLGQPTHFSPGRQWGVFAVKLPRDLGNKRLSWTLVANGFTNTITLHTQPDYIVEPYMDAANKNTPPVIKFDQAGEGFTGPPSEIAAKYTATVGVPLALTTYATDEGPKINVPETGGGRGRGRGRGTAAEPDAAARGGDPAAARGGDAAAARGAEPGAAPQGRGAARGGRGGEFLLAARLAVTWTKFRGPGDVKFDNAKPTVDIPNAGKATTNATFSAPGDYILRIEGNDSTGSGGGGFQCCWTNAYVAVTVKAAGTK